MLLQSVDAAFTLIKIHAFVSFFGFASDLDWTLGSQHSTKIVRSTKVNINVIDIEFDINSSSVPHNPTSLVLAHWVQLIIIMLA